MHLRVKVFFGTSEKAVKSQIWIAVPVYLLVAIIKKCLNVSRRQYEILQILMLGLFEKIRWIQHFRVCRSSRKPIKITIN